MEELEEIRDKLAVEYQEENGGKLGQAKFATWNLAMKKFWDELPEDDKETCKKTAIQWNAGDVPEEIQQQ